MSLVRMNVRSKGPPGAVRGLVMGDQQPCCVVRSPSRSFVRTGKPQIRL